MVDTFTVPNRSPPGADDVQRHGVDMERQRVLQNRVTEADDLVDGLSLGVQGDQEAGQLRLRGLALHDSPHRPGRLTDAESLLLEEVS